MFSKTLLVEASRLQGICREKKIMLASAESCTGGLIAALLTELAGSSAFFERGFVTYSNKAKTALLGVPAALIERHGAVSAPVAKAMAEGAVKRSKAHLSIAVTGIAGPGSEGKKPVGLVYIGIAAKKGKTAVVKCRFKGDRSSIRLNTVKKAMALLKARLARFS